MQTLIHRYQSVDGLQSFLQKIMPADNPVLLQVMAGDQHQNQVTAVLALIQKALPKIVIIGASTSGEIHQDQISDGSCYWFFRYLNRLNFILFMLLIQPKQPDTRLLIKPINSVQNVR